MKKIKILKIPKIYLKIYLKILYLIPFLFALGLLPIIINATTDGVLTPLELNARSLSLIKYFYFTLSYGFILITAIKIIFKAYESIFLLSNTGKLQGYYEIKIKLPKLVKNESNVGKYK